MDPISLALGALQLGAAGYDYYDQARLNRAENRFGQDQANAQINAAVNAREQFADDLRRRRRQMQESLAARGVEDSTIATDDMNYLNRGAERTQLDMDNRVNLAQKGLALFKKKAKSARRGNYMKLGVGLAGALGGAYKGVTDVPGLMPMS